MSKQIISPGQALLLLIDRYKQHSTKVAELKEFYLCGVKNRREMRRIWELFRDDALLAYDVSFSNKTINDDPTRRYFETHLAYETLKDNLCHISIDDLKAHDKALRNIPKRNIDADIADVMTGQFEESHDEYGKENADYISKLRKKKIFSQFSYNNRVKIEYLVKNVFLGVINARIDRNLPLPIYDIGIFSEINRGKIELCNQTTTRSQHLGLMKGHMPLPLDDVAKAETTLPFLKPSDQATFIENTTWVNLNFEKLVHPFSNSISGTMLCQLRVLAQLKDAGIKLFTETSSQLSRYIQLFCAARLFHSGGHSLNEFISPLYLPAVRKEFSDIPEFEKIDIKSLYLTNNTSAFENALADTIRYNNMIILRRTLHQELPLAIQKRESVISNFLTVIPAWVTNYEKQTQQQFLSSVRAGCHKHRVIQKNIDKIIEYLKTNQLTKAKNVAHQLTHQIESKFGKTNFFGKKSAAYILVKSIEQSLTEGCSPRTYRVHSIGHYGRPILTHQ